MSKEQVCEGVYKVEIPIPYDSGIVNCYLIEGENGYTVIDTGDYNAAAIQAWEEVLGDATIERVIITHAHADHFGLAPWFQRQYGATIVMSSLTEKEFLLRKSFFNGDKIESTAFQFLADYGFVNEAGGEIFNQIEAYDFLPDEVFDTGSNVRIGDYDAQSILTPGHSPDHTCFYIADIECLFIGDHLLQGMSTIVMPHDGMENPLTYYIPTFEELSRLNIAYVLSGHGERIESLQERVEQVKKRYENRWQQILEQLTTGEKTAWDLTYAMYEQSKVAFMNSAFLQTITNLNYLASKGEVEKFKKGEIWTFKLDRKVAKGL